MAQADDIRKYILEHFIEPEREEGRNLITVRAGDVRDAMVDEGLIPQSNIRNVCQALSGGMMRKRAGAESSEIVESPPSGFGSNFFVRFTFKASQADKKKAAELVDQGKALFDAKNWRGLITLMGETIQLDPKINKAWFNRGNAKSGLGQFEEAIEDYDKAIKIDPKDAEILNNQGWAHYQLGKLDQAEEYFEKAIELDPELDPAARGLLAIARLRETQKSGEKITREEELSREIFLGNADELRERQRKAEKSIHSLDDAIFGAWMIITLIVIFYFAVFLFPLLISKPEIEFSIFKNIFYFSTFLMLVFPFIWGIRILMTAKEKQEILREDYYRRALVDTTINRVFSSVTPSDDTPELQEQRRSVWANYIATWTSHSPAEMMLQFRSKGRRSDSSNAHPLEIVLNKCQEVISKKPDGSS